MRFHSPVDCPPHPLHHLRMVRRVLTPALLVSAIALGAGCAKQGVRSVPANTVESVQSAVPGDAPSAKPGSSVQLTPSGSTRYSNPRVGLKIDFPAGWVIWSRMEDMRADFRGSVGTLEQNGVEVLFAGHKNNVLGARLTTENLGVPLDDYATLIIDINKREIGKVKRTDKRLGGRDVVFWEASHAETGLEFIEYVFREGTHNLRLTFWTHPSLKARYVPEFQRIVESARTVRRIY